jgi:hypothetical protein
MNFYSKKILILIFLSSIYGVPEKKQTLLGSFITRISNKESNKIIGLTTLTSLVVGGFCLERKIPNSYIVKGIALQVPLLLYISRKNSEYYNFKKKQKKFNWASLISTFGITYFLIKKITSDSKIIEYINNHPWRSSGILSVSPFLMHILGVWIEEYYYYKKFQSSNDEDDKIE